MLCCRTTEGAETVMPFSGLCSGTILSPFYSRGRFGHTVDSVAIHCMAGTGSAEACGYLFQKPGQDASSNYGVDGEGKIFGYVDEDNTAWTTSSSGVATRSITIEVANSEVGDPWPVTDKALEALIELLVDICSRYKIYLNWANDEEYAHAAADGGPVTRQNMFVHRWFAQKSCPGPYLFERHGQIADAVNLRLRRGGSNIPVIFNSAVDARQGKSKCIFIGDSRTVGMQMSVGRNEHIWSAEVGLGLDWMKSTGVPAIESKVASDTAVCILMGINDFRRTNGAEAYSSYINECANRWVQRGAAVYFVSVNPVSKSGYNGITNEAIAEFNQSVRNKLNSSVGYIDTFSKIIDTFESPDGLHYTSTTYKEIYETIISAVKDGSSSSSSLFSNGSSIGGSPVQVDYMKINPYILTIDRDSPVILDFDKLHESRVVGAILEIGYLYDKSHNKVKFKQPRFERQYLSLQQSNLEIGYYFTARARTRAEAESEIDELSRILRNHPCKLGVWIRLEFPSKNVDINDRIIDYYYDRLVALGFIRKVGFYTTEESLSTFTWSKHKNNWLLWLVNHVTDTDELKKLLDPEFFKLPEQSEASSNFLLTEAGA